MRSFDRAGEVERHVVLIGLPGAGKTSVGRRLAKELDRPFADADEQLALAAGRTVPRFFREEGEAELRQMEARVLADLLHRDAPLVVSAAGGTAIDDAIRTLLTAQATVIWLRGSIKFLVERSDPTHRPLLVNDHEQGLSKLDAARSAVYQEIADQVVDIEPFHGVDGEPRRAIARHIAQLVSANATPAPAR